MTAHFFSENLVVLWTSFFCVAIISFFSNKKMPKKSQIFSCIICAFNTSKQSNYKKHLTTRKHNLATLSTNRQHVDNEKEPQHTCVQCLRKYTDRSGLWRHKRSCKPEVSLVSQTMDIAPSPNDTMFKLMKELCISNIETNKQIVELMREKEQRSYSVVSATSSTPTTTNIINHITNTNTNNTQINVNMFLNEYCKDAMTIDDFIQSIQINMADMMYMAKHGNKEGLLAVIRNSLNQLQITERPLHCTDTKRHTTYVKENTGWNKENDQKHLKRLCSKTEHACLVKTMDIINENPKYTTNGTQEYETAIKMMMESNGGCMGSEHNRGGVIRQLEETISLDKHQIMDTVRISETVPKIQDE